MAVIRKKGGKEMAAISTASLPDVIFMILFFFMVTTTMREVELVVIISPPTASEIQKLENKALVSYIYVGAPIVLLQPKLGAAPRIQLNDSFQTARQIGEFVASEREKLDEADRNTMTICLKADKETPMGIITDVKQECRKANALKFSYAASKTLGY